jgi:hypothetical protein
MSTFNCPKCNAPHYDTRLGYVSGCEHSPQRKCDACGGDFEPIDDHPGWLGCPSCWRAVVGSGGFTCPRCESHYFGRVMGEVDGVIVPLETVRCHGSSSGPLFYGDSRGRCGWRGVWPLPVPAPD